MGKQAGKGVGRREGGSEEGRKEQREGGTKEGSDRWYQTVPSAAVRKESPSRSGPAPPPDDAPPKRVVTWFDTITGMKKVSATTHGGPRGVGVGCGFWIQTRVLALV